MERKKAYIKTHKKLFGKFHAGSNQILQTHVNAFQNNLQEICAYLGLFAAALLKNRRNSIV